jgi:cytochrome c2
VPKIKSQILKNLILKLSLPIVFLLVSCNNSYAQDAKVGQSLFKANCSSCHRVFGKMTGPELAGVTIRRENSWLQKWVKNAPAMKASGDKIALEIDAQYPANMPAFTQLSEEDIHNILSYVESEEKKKNAEKTNSQSLNLEKGQSDISPELVYFIIGMLIINCLAVLVIISLARALKTMKDLAERRQKI